MNFAQRAFAYVMRKRGKTASLFLAVFTVGVFLICCFDILNASARLGRDIRTALGAAFYIRANAKASMGGNGETVVTENDVHITQKEIDEIMQMGKIRYCNPVNYGFAKSDAIQFIPGDQHTADNNMGKAKALRYSALAPDFVDETAVLAEGRHIREGDRAKILISQPLADANHISVGDSIPLTHARLGEDGGAYIDEIPVKSAYAQVQVCGIYRLDAPSDASMKPTAGLPENEIYASLDVLDRLQESETGIYTGEVDFYITDPAELENITGNVRGMQSIDWNTHFIRTNDFQYSKISDHLSSLGDLVRLLIVLVSVVSGGILNLLLAMRMHGRRREAGILLAVGISKWQVLAGFLLEVLWIAVVALALSYLASLGLAGYLGQKIFGGMQPNLLKEESLAAGVGSGPGMEDYLRLGGMEALLIYLCQFLVIAASVIASSFAIMRQKPKEILSRL
ncbi:MAG: ABC transporter permease [Lachnospiraceae bacterium]|nr:ABC transporter permease [Lachnospiraceae bacterium]